MAKSKTAKSKGAPRIGKAKRTDTKSASAGKGKPSAFPGNSNPRRAPRKSPWREIRLVLIAVIWLSLVGGGFIAYAAHDLPSTEGLTGPKSAPALTILAADGSRLAQFGADWGEFVHLHDMSPLLPQAVIAIEDRRFYEHSGMDILGVLRAIWRNIMSGHLREGGSTITQQLAKIAFLTPAKSLKRKVQELFLAFHLENKFTKDEILTLYLNRVYLGAGTYGVDAAARRYFGKSASEVSLSQAALLAGLLKAPSRLSPARNLKAAHRRAALVLDSMATGGFVSEADAAYAKGQPTKLIKQEKLAGSAHHFCDWVRAQLPAHAGRNSAALTVYTTLDPTLQMIAETALARGLENVSKHDAREGALVALAQDGAVLAMVGGRDYDESQFNRASQALRQPGSAFKTIVYLAGIEAGLTPDDTFDDAPIEIAGWAPRNYSGKYQGPVSLRRAFAESINSVAVRVGQHAGIDEVAKLARHLGINSNLPPDASLSLGSGEVSLLQLTAAYAPLIASTGALALPHGIHEIRNRGGDIIYRREGSGGGRVIATKSAAAMRDLLAAVVKFGTGHNAALSPEIGPAHGKTGTSQNFRDAWFIGFARNIVAGVWLGNDDGQAMRGITGGGAPAKIWRHFMNRALR